MTPDYASLSSCSCSENGNVKSQQRLYFKYPYTSTTTPFFIAVLPVNTLIKEKKSVDSSFSMLASERSFADIWNDPQEDVWDKL
jgi:hypothetical protein